MTRPDPFLRPLRHVDDANLVVAEVEALLAQAGLRFRQAPPVPTTCCGRGCNGCVWEGFFFALRYWREQAAELLASAAVRPAVADVRPEIE
ncbi:MAG: oxidoreductase [Azoarcus sp.]|nr:MAG: oxidoreductase [Azoarcus sp.]TVT54010.1 MAG: oxidoreductase [Azoarcus sp. PHD]